MLQVDHKSNHHVASQCPHLTYSHPVQVLLILMWKPDKLNLSLCMWCPLFLPISPFCFSPSLNRFGVLVASLSFWYVFIFFHVQDFFRLLLFLVLSGFPYFFALCLLLSLLFPPLCCTCWHLMSNMKIGTTAGKYSMCIILGPFHKGTRAKRKSATNPPQWVHIPLLCFFCLVCFLSLLLFLCCRVYPGGGSTKTNPEHGGTAGDDSPQPTIKTVTLRWRSSIQICVIDDD